MTQPQLHESINGFTIYDYYSNNKVRLVGGDNFGRVATIRKVFSNDTLLVMVGDIKKCIHFSEAIPLDSKGKAVKPYLGKLPNQV